MSIRIRETSIEIQLVPVGAEKNHIEKSLPSSCGKSGERRKA
jgi:hypothetical protein